MSPDHQLDLLRRLVACPSTTGTPSTVVDLLAAEVTALGGEVTLLPVGPGTAQDSPEYSPPSAVDGPQPPVLLAGFPGDQPELVLFAHTDTEPVHPGWQTDPLDLQVDGARAVGLGVADDKAGVVAVLAAVDRWQRRGRPGWRPRLVLGAGKQGGALGTLPGVAAAAGAQAAVYSHPAESGAGLGHLKVASRGIVQCRVRVPGRTPPPVEERTPVSADPTAGVNAAVRAARLATAVAGWPTGDRVWGVVGLRAGGAPYEVPGAAELDVACWFSAGTVEQVVDELRDRLAAAEERTGWPAAHPLEVTPVGVRANPADCAGSPFAEQVAAVLARRTGAVPGDYRWHSASDIRFPIRCLGVPAVGFGALAGGFYGPGEWVDLPSLEQSIEVLTDVLCAGPA
ncbi:M20 family metallopeptidase [Modestobacter versicolor]|uniref:M20 family metallopeptidase n=1 Tax=Modestobacter versicolor TaxID=429133 RepID=UPI0034DEC115